MARRRQAGFTLFEVLVAFAVAALAVTVALQALSRGFAANRRAVANAVAVLHAESLLDRFATLLPPEATTTGRTGDGLAWRATVERQPAPDGARTRPVTVVVEVWPAAGPPVRLATLRLEPTGVLAR